MGRMIVPLAMAAALSLGAFLLQRHWRRRKRSVPALHPQKGPNFSQFVERIGLQPGAEASSLLAGRTVIASSL